VGCEAWAPVVRPDGRMSGNVTNGRQKVKEIWKRAQKNYKVRKTAKDAKSAKQRKDKKQAVYPPCFFFSWRSWRTWRFKNRLCNSPGKRAQEDCKVLINSKNSHSEHPRIQRSRAAAKRNSHKKHQKTQIVSFATDETRMKHRLNTIN